MPWPERTFVLDSPGLARELSLPPDRDEFMSDIVRSYRLRQGVLHNPVNDRRTTQGVFHVTEGGLPIPDDKMAVPKIVFGRLLDAGVAAAAGIAATAVHLDAGGAGGMFCFAAAPAGGLPGGARDSSRRSRWRSAFSRRAIWSATWILSNRFSATRAIRSCRKMTRGWTCEHWTGHTGCVILAPHLVKVTKKSLGLPHWDEATERQRRDGMCWKDENECYNDGGAFKITARDERGVIVTIIADNYFGYCKKEVKTQISYAANLYGLCEEEHAGGALVYASYDLGEEFYADKHVRYRGPFLRGSPQLAGAAMELQPEGYAIDKQYPGHHLRAARRSL